MREGREEPMLVMKALFKLIVIDLYLLRGNFAALYHKVRSYPIASKRPKRNMTEAVCSAVDIACMWYPKHSLCLQRSSVITCLLREQGVPAKMVIGAQKVPFRAHAWVEVDGRIVNDKPYVSEIYAVLDKC